MKEMKEMKEWKVKVDGKLVTFTMADVKRHDARRDSKGGDLRFGSVRGDKWMIENLYCLAWQFFHPEDQKCNGQALIKQGMSFKTA